MRDINIDQDNSALMLASSISHKAKQGKKLQVEISKSTLERLLMLEQLHLEELSHLNKNTKIELKSCLTATFYAKNTN